MVFPFSGLLSLSIVKSVNYGKVGEASHHSSGRITVGPSVKALLVTMTIHSLVHSTAAWNIHAIGEVHRYYNADVRMTTLTKRYRHDNDENVVSRFRRVIDFEGSEVNATSVYSSISERKKTDQLSSRKPVCLDHDWTLAEYCSLPKDERLSCAGTLSLKFCDTYPLTNYTSSSLNDIIEVPSANVDDKKECLSELQHLFDLDSAAADAYDIFLTILSQIDCDDPYSNVWNCDHCKAAYKDWICAVTIPHYSGDERVSPCSHFCKRVENHCPYIQPQNEHQFAGEALFICPSLVNEEHRHLEEECFYFESSTQDRLSPFYWTNLERHSTLNTSLSLPIPSFNGVTNRTISLSSKSNVSTNNSNYISVISNKSDMDKQTTNKSSNSNKYTSTSSGASSSNNITSIVYINLSIPSIIFYCLEFVLILQFSYTHSYLSH